MKRCDLLGRVSEEPDCLVRPFASEAMKKANELVAGWMREAGMTARQDNIGNLIGHYGGTGNERLVLGSHLDTVSDAGRYDGTLGVLVALACVQRLHERGEHLPFAIEVVAFADEDGLRYGTTYLGSSVYAGAFDPELLNLEDRDGVPVAEAIRSFGGDPDALPGDEARDVMGYCEVHIEQGPVLERLGLPVGVVSAISGQSHVDVTFLGEAGHAGTVPIEGRRDALCAAAEFVLAVEERARDEPDVVATVGHISIQPGANNVIPGEVYLSLDIRHKDDEARERARDSLSERAKEITVARGLEHRWSVRGESRAVQTDPELAGLLSSAVEESCLPVERLPSGAGHDAAQVADIAPVAMLFVRCEGGISHNPAESVDTKDVAVAVDILDRFLKLVGHLP